MTQIPGAKDYYDVSPDGTVTSYFRGCRVLKPKIGKDGYARVSLVPAEGGPAEWHLLNRVVLRAFRGDAPPGMESRHLNGDPLDNRLENLEWATHSVNLRDKRRHGTDHNATKTHCVQGHEYTEENTYTHLRGEWVTRDCRACARERSTAYRRRKVAP